MRSPVARNLLGFWLLAFVAVYTAGYLAVWYWAVSLPYEAASGVWTALGDDVAHGVLYRPIVSALGYGGTRYMPGFFSLVGLLIWAGIPASVSGPLLTGASLCFAGFAAYHGMRRFGIGPVLALIAVLTLCGSFSVQMLIIAVRGDLLALALNLSGLVFFLKGTEERRAFWTVLSGVAFAFAILTKFTEVFALVTVGLWSLRRGTWSSLAWLGTGILPVLAGGVGLIYWLSAGRCIDSWLACGSGGVASSYAWQFLRWFTLSATCDYFFVVLLLIGMVAWVRRFRRLGWDLPLLYFVVTGVLTVLLWVSPGISFNHLIDLLVATVALSFLEVEQGWLAGGWGVGLPLFGCLWVVATWFPRVPSARGYFVNYGRPTRDEVRELGRRLQVSPGTRLLAEDPMVAIELGLRPEVLDAFSLHLISAHDPAIARRFFGDLSAGRFTAVVLTDWSDVPIEQRWAELQSKGGHGVAQHYGGQVFPAGFLEVLGRSYELAFVTGPYVVFKPRPR